MDESLQNIELGLGHILLLGCTASKTALPSPVWARVVKIRMLATPGEVVEVVHDHSHKEVEHEEAAEEDEGDKVGVGEV